MQGAIIFKAFYGAIFLAVRCGEVWNRTAPHRRILDKKIRIAPHRRVIKNKRTAPHGRIWWQSVEQAFLTVQIELIRRKKPPRTVPSNYVNRVKCHDLYDESD